MIRRRPLPPDRNVRVAGLGHHLHHRPRLLPPIARVGTQRLFRRRATAERPHGHVCRRKCRQRPQPGLQDAAAVRGVALDAFPTIDTRYNKYY